MKRRQTLFLVICIITGIVLFGCATSEESSEKQETVTPAAAPMEKTPQKTEPVVSPKIDTVNVDRQNTQKPDYEPKTAPQTHPAQMPSGKYAVQIGAYKMPDNAERVAALARERLGKNVYSVHDENDNLYKVMIGDFPTKEEARRFRDVMAEKYPSDYKDAWVSEIPRK